MIPSTKTVTKIEKTIDLYLRKISSSLDGHLVIYYLHCHSFMFVSVKLIHQLDGGHLHNEYKRNPT
ncbi:hypothetical protein GLYMA_01G151900v4 [Glycine max]|uniref:Uncharacterized protein n=1 Tax=Glycine max TaxID=3847 RepID=K7K401_SOYBN|nr:hypothetical protein JHK85_001919 [Glycine max]KAG5089255.1 hypothetical protein JHK86_001867 [Glycine max]KAH1163206.1 hypothetical protein GYH30_001647 [Glycine max]KRH76425.1 hypothetical protein GLYMA_01G151900v4 [Glycine max]